MSFTHLEQLPFVGMSHEFVGEKQGAPFSAYVVTAKPGEGPPLHRHPYVEVAFTIEGRATITVGDEQREMQAGGIAVIRGYAAPLRQLRQHDAASDRHPRQPAFYPDKPRLNPSMRNRPSSRREMLEV
jgi:glyoxylate utilization-related uncharacterized protein